VFSAPSGTGKTTLACRLLDRHGGPGGNLVRSVSITTRPPRCGEVDGKDYRFVTSKRFAALLSQGELLEHARLYGHRYGTPRAPVECCLARGVDVLLVVDACGRRQLADSHGTDLVSVFLLPPSLPELERRLRGRGQDDENTIDRRLQAAREEIARSRQYDYVLLNHDLQETLEALGAILAAERLRRQHATCPSVVVGWR
jgi:guanylate kinase